ncbi:TcpQ domain-containing protein [Thalassotalea sp. LPB0316]|uniref:TcpQ domain-containing protein n=1 Tax=Thalassotalea sp. LPB0316 TaxID=2769490 RepID=UPI0018696233|nr:TcpQ domain-containing protein [Thalassotalea sp. LPB0316]QOL26931.1 TcpQ domain-containing protein [Thalassotalea sp. LPB0316]
MTFWIRNLIFGAILAGVAYVLLANLDMISDFANSFTQSTEQKSEDDTQETFKTDAAPTAKPTPESQDERKSSNRAAEGLSNFYASIRPGLDGKGPVIRKNIVYLNQPEGSLEDILEARKMITRPYRKNWRGDRENRPFRTGETLYQKLDEYGQQQGLEIVWWLDKDFIVKDPFRIDRNIVRTSYQIGKAIEGHFENGVDVYFCHQHRNITLISGENNYLAQNCTLLDAQNAG